MSNITPHLNEEQIAELVAASPRQLRELSRNPDQDPSLAAIQAHAAECAECAAEIASLRESLALFRDASSAYADAQLDHMPVFRPPAQRPVLRQPAYWATAAAAVLLAGFLPLQTHFRQREKAPAPVLPAEIAQHAAPPSESDEALLEDVTRELSATVPAPMEALADPTGSASTSTNTTQRTN